MKKNDRGFMLVEFLVVSIFVLGTHIFLTIQFNNINRSYNRSFKYNTVPGIYAANNVKNMLLKDGYEDILNYKTNNNLNYVDFTTCPVEYFSDKDFCSSLLLDSNIKTVIFTSEDLSEFKNDTNYNKYSEGFRTYISSLNSNAASTKMLVILEFKDDTYASLRVN